MNTEEFLRFQEMNLSKYALHVFTTVLGRLMKSQTNRIHVSIIVCLCMFWLNLGTLGVSGTGRVSWWWGVAWPLRHAPSAVVGVLSQD